MLSQINRPIDNLQGSRTRMYSALIIPNPGQWKTAHSIKSPIQEAGEDLKRLVVGASNQKCRQPNLLS